MTVHFEHEQLLESFIWKPLY